MARAACTGNQSKRLPKDMVDRDVDRGGNPELAQQNELVDIIEPKDMAVQGCPSGPLREKKRSGDGQDPLLRQVSSG